MKISSTSFVLSFALGITGLALAGCKLNNNDNNETACAGYVGCSAHTDKAIGIAPPQVVDASASDTKQTLHAINLGCGKPLPDTQVPTMPGKPIGYTHFSVMATGATLQGTITSKAGPRTFWVRVPADYDPNHKYRVQYIGQGCGGYEVANNSTVQFFKESSGGTEEAIYVALDIPRDMANQDCYDNNSGPKSQEWEAFQLFQDFIDQNYCVDNNRVYVSGYSTGGWLNDMWGCYFAGDGAHPWNGVPGTIPTSTSSSLQGIQLTSRAGSIGDGGAADAPGTNITPSGDGGSSLVHVTTEPAGANCAAGGVKVDQGPDVNGDGVLEASEIQNTGYVCGEAAPTTAGAARMFAPEYHIRAQAGISGAEPANNPPCNGPIAAIWIHDLNDSNPYTGNHDVALPRVLKMNGCFSATPPTVPWHEDIMGKGVCVQYTDCPAAYPVVFCTTVGQGHADQHERAIPGFVTFFKEMEAAAGLNKSLP